MQYACVVVSHVHCTHSHTLFNRVCAERKVLVDYYTTHAVFQVIKEYIRRAKDWRNRKFGKHDREKPSSYLMSLLVVKAYEYAKGCNHRAGASE